MKHVFHPMKWVLWGLAAFFYFFEYFLRVAPSVMVPQLMETFSVDATAIGTLSAFYFYIYAPMQIPVGVLTDRYGARNSSPLLH
jgi:sugar phosphate permease